MIFRRVDPYHGVSDCRRYIINRVNVTGAGVYTAVRASETGKKGAPGLPPERLRQSRFADGDEDGRATAWRACVEACERDAEARRGE